MRPQQPQVAGPAHGRAGARCGREGVGGVGPVLAGGGEAFDAEVDLGHLEAGRLEGKVELGQREVAQRLGEQLLVPARGLGELVVGQHEGAGPLRAEVVEADHRHLGPTEMLAGQHPAVAGHHPALAVDEHGHVEAEGLDAARDLADLLRAVQAGVAPVELEPGDRPVLDAEPAGRHGAGGPRVLAPRGRVPVRAAGHRGARVPAGVPLPAGGGSRFGSAVPRQPGFVNRSHLDLLAGGDPRPGVLSTISTILVGRVFSIRPSVSRAPRGHGPLHVPGRAACLQGRFGYTARPPAGSAPFVAVQARTSGGPVRLASPRAGGPRGRSRRGSCT